MANPVAKCGRVLSDGTHVGSHPIEGLLMAFEPDGRRQVASVGFGLGRRKVRWRFGREARRLRGKLFFRCTERANHSVSSSTRGEPGRNVWPAGRRCVVIRIAGVDQADLGLPVPAAPGLNSPAHRLARRPGWSSRDRERSWFDDLADS